MIPLRVARAKALFLSPVSAATIPARADVDRAVRCTVRSRGGVRGCDAAVAEVYGACPELAVPRMRWALTVVDLLYPTPVITRPARVVPAPRPRQKVGV